MCSASLHHSTPARARGGCWHRTVRACAATAAAPVVLAAAVPFPLSHVFSSPDGPGGGRGTQESSNVCSHVRRPGSKLDERCAEIGASHSAPSCARR